MKTMTNDADLLRQYVEAKSETAFAELVERHLGLVYHTASRQSGGDSHLAQDIAQTVFVLLTCKAQSLLGHPSLAGWLYTTTLFKTSKALRAERRRRHWEQEAHAVSEQLEEPCPTPDWENLRPLLDGAVMKLNKPDREAVLLRYFEGRPFAEIGQRIGLSEGSAQKRVERALDRLRRLLAQRKVTSTSAALATILSSHAGLAAPPGLAGSISSFAFASAATVAVPPLSLFTIMSTTKITAGLATLVGILSILGIVSIGTGIYELRKSHLAQVELETDTQQYEAGQKHLQTLMLEAAGADATLADLQKQFARLAIDSARIASDPTKVATAEDPVKAESKTDWENFTKAFPEVRDMTTEVDQAVFERTYRKFMAEAGLTPAQIEAFESRTVELWDQGIAMSPHGFHPTTNQLPDDQLRAILGDQAFQKLQDYNRIIPANVMANKVSISTGNAGAPLSSDQEKQLAQIFAANSASFENGGSVKLDSVDWSNAAIQAQGILSPAQLKTAQGVLLDYQFSLALAQAKRVKDGAQQK